MDLVRPPILVLIDHGPPIACESAAQLDELLDRLHMERSRKIAEDDACPLLVSISAAGYEVYVGLGADAVPVTIGLPASDDFYTAVGDESAKGESVMFYGASDDTYWEPSHLIPIPLAREIVRDYVANQQLSETVKWEH